MSTTHFQLPRTQGHVFSDSDTPLVSELKVDTVESRLSDLRLSDIPLYPTCRVGTLHFINSHSEGLNSIKTALAYVEQQREATATDVLLFRRWRDLVAKKRKEAQKQITITNFLKKNFHLQIYIMFLLFLFVRFFHLMPYCIFFVM
jgi:hypothetical protein